MARSNETNTARPVLARAARSLLLLLVAALAVGCGDGDGDGGGRGLSGGAWFGAASTETTERPAVYTYTTRSGTTGFADSLGQVPRAYRARARIKLVSKDSLNGALASALASVAAEGISLDGDLARAFSRQMSVEHTELAASEGCANARSVNAEASTALGTARWVWRQHSIWVVAGGAALLLLFTAPFVARRVGAARWMRTVFVCIGALASLTTMAHVGNRAIGTLRGARQVASLCDQTTDDPVVLAGTVAQLRDELERGTELRDRVLSGL